MKSIENVSKQASIENVLANEIKKEQYDNLTKRG